MTETDFTLSISPTLVSHVGVHSVTVGKAIILNPTEANRSYSSVYLNDAVGTGNARSTLDSAQAWSALTSDVN
jgi:hypothetical protein